MKMKIEIIKADITILQVDAIVNAANNALTGGGGVDGAIHKAAGNELRNFCAAFRGCETGNAKISPGFNLPAKFVIHAVGPVWQNGTKNEEALLAACYENSLQLAEANHVMTIAFPCISTGAYRFPFSKACRIALKTIDEFLKKSSSIGKVFLAVYDERKFINYQKILNEFYK